jgi:hypothetical protein
MQFELNSNLLDDTAVNSWLESVNYFLPKCLR